VKVVETSFTIKTEKIIPKAGAMVIAPMVFTHTHRENVPNS